MSFCRWFIWGAIVAVFSATVQGAEPDLSTPTAAIKAFYGALLNGDAKAAEAVSVAGENEIEFIEASVEIGNAFVHLSKAATDKLGPDGAKLNVPLPATLVLKKLDKEQPKLIDDNTAKWSANPNAPLRLVKQDGKWKLDLTASFAEHDAKVAAELFRKIATYVDEVAADIDAGKLTSVVDVQKEMVRRRKLLDAELAEKK